MWRWALSSLKAHPMRSVGPGLVIALATSLLVACNTWFAEGFARGGTEGQFLIVVMASCSGTTMFAVIVVVAAQFATAFRERHRDFALLRTVGASKEQLRTIVTAEVFTVSAIAVVIGSFSGHRLAELLTGPVAEASLIQPSRPSFSPLSILVSAALMAFTAWAGARLAARAVTSGSASDALRTAAVETRTPSAVRSIVGLILGAVAIVGILTPVAAGGTAGAASAAGSVLVFLGAAALCGPWIITKVGSRLSIALQQRGKGSLALAVMCARGYARRMSVVVMSLAMVITIATMQTSTERITAKAASEQYANGVSASWFCVGPAGSRSQDRHSLESLPGVAGVATSTSVIASLETDDEVPSFLDMLAWEPVALRILEGPWADFIDPRLREGSWHGLNQPDTVAVSSDVLFATGLGLGSTLALRVDDMPARDVQIVAIYDRGLGSGDAIAAGGLADLADRHASTEYLVAADGSNEVKQALTSQNITFNDRQTHLQDSQDSMTDSQDLGRILLLLLASFVALAALTMLAGITQSRRNERSMMRSIGMTRGEFRPHGVTRCRPGRDHVVVYRVCRIGACFRSDLLCTHRQACSDRRLDSLHSDKCPGCSHRAASDHNAAQQNVTGVLKSRYFAQASVLISASQHGPCHDAVMGFFVYGNVSEHEIEDRALAHLKVAVGLKLRRQECFFVSWTNPVEVGSGRVSLWLSPHIPIAFKFSGNRPPQINPVWVEVLRELAHSPRGLVLVSEKEAESYARRNAPDGAPGGSDESSM